MINETVLIWSFSLNTMQRWCPYNESLYINLIISKKELIKSFGKLFLNKNIHFTSSSFSPEISVSNIRCSNDEDWRLFYFFTSVLYFLFWFYSICKFQLIECGFFLIHLNNSLNPCKLIATSAKPWSFCYEFIFSFWIWMALFYFFE